MFLLPARKKKTKKGKVLEPKAARALLKKGQRASPGSSVVLSSQKKNCQEWKERPKVHPLISPSLGLSSRLTLDTDVSKPQKKRKKQLSFDEMLGHGTDDSPEKQVRCLFLSRLTIPQTVLDMRGPTARFVLDPSLLGLNESETVDAETGPPLLGQELLYNLNLIVDIEQVSVALSLSLSLLASSSALLLS
jgi:hypothetical protein